jgi:hypothetical protein
VLFIVPGRHRSRVDHGLAQRAPRLLEVAVRFEVGLAALPLEYDVRPRPLGDARQHHRVGEAAPQREVAAIRCTIAGRSWKAV